MTIAAIAAKYLASCALKLARKVAAADMPDLGAYIGKYSCVKINRAAKELLGVTLYSTDIYKCDVEPLDPIRWMQFDTGLEFAPRLQSFVCDLGSIPWVFHNAKFAHLHPSDFTTQYFFHDVAYWTAQIMVRKTGSDKWSVMDLDRRAADVLLYQMLSCPCPKSGLQANRAESQAIYRSVRLAAAGPWKRHRERPK